MQVLCVNSCKRAHTAGCTLVQYCIVECKNASKQNKQQVDKFGVCVCLFQNDLIMAQRRHPCCSSQCCFSMQTSVLPVLFMHPRFVQNATTEKSVAVDQSTVLTVSKNLPVTKPSGSCYLAMLLASYCCCLINAMRCIVQVRAQNQACWLLLILFLSCLLNIYCTCAPRASIFPADSTPALAA